MKSFTNCKNPSKVTLEQINQGERRRAGTRNMMRLSEKSLEVESVSKKQAETLYVFISIIRQGENIKKTFA
jgi:hypothetical protein